MASEPPAILAEGLVKRFGKTVALDGLDLEVQAGTILGLLGPNGAGKTTAVRIFTTLLEPDGGRARSRASTSCATPTRLRSQIGLAGQYAAVDALLTGRENLADGRAALPALARDARERAPTSCSSASASSTPPTASARTYSGGMRRRLDLAASMVVAPPVMFLDEPTTGLDPRSRLDVWGLIGELVAGGTTMLLTTQYLEEADHLADRIAVIDHGRTIALRHRRRSSSARSAASGSSCGSRAAPTLAGASEILARHVEGAGARRRGRAPRLGGRASTGRGASPTSSATSTRAGIGLDDLAVRRPTLDDVFLTLTGHARRGEAEAA